MRHELYASWVGSEGKPPLPCLRQGYAWRHSPSVVRDRYGVRGVDATGDVWARLQSDVSVEDADSVDLEKQVVRRGVHFPEVPSATPLDESCPDRCGDAVTGPDA